LLLFLKGLLGILDVTIAMKVRFLTNNSMNCQIYNIPSTNHSQIPTNNFQTQFFWGRWNWIKIRSVRSIRFIETYLHVPRSRLRLRT
jgi:hypothetical protein